MDASALDDPCHLSENPLPKAVDHALDVAEELVNLLVDPIEAVCELLDVSKVFAEGMVGRVPSNQLHLLDEAVQHTARLLDLAVTLPDVLVRVLEPACRTRFGGTAAVVVVVAHGAS